MRSDAELTELAYELFEQEEASVRFRKTHATIPPMLIDKKDQQMRFYNENSRIPDPMALHREAKFTNIWTEEEKSIFRDKYVESPIVKDGGLHSFTLCSFLVCIGTLYTPRILR